MNTTSPSAAFLVVRCEEKTNNELLINLCICNSNKNLFKKNSQLLVEAIT